MNTRLIQQCIRCRKWKEPSLGRFIFIPSSRQPQVPKFICAHCDRPRRFKTGRRRTRPPSPLELRARRTLLDYGLPFTEEFALEPWTFDFAIPSLALLVEVDGKVHQYRRRKDYLKHRDAKAAGWGIVHLTSHDLEGRLRAVLDLRAEKLSADGNGDDPEGGASQWRFGPKDQ